jgi:hypothetical protein
LRYVPGNYILPDIKQDKFGTVQLFGQIRYRIKKNYLISSVAEPHHFYAAPAPGENFDAAPAAPAPTLLYSKAKFLKRTKVYTHVETILFL